MGVGRRVLILALSPTTVLLVVLLVVQLHYECPSKGVNPLQPGLLVVLGAGGAAAVVEVVVRHAAVLLLLLPLPPPPPLCVMLLLLLLLSRNPTYCRWRSI